MCVLTNACAARPLRAERRAGVEAEPAEPEDAGADQRQRQRVRGHRRARPAAPPPDHQHDGQRRDARVDVHDGAAREVERAPLEQPARRREHPVRDGRVHEDRPRARGTTTHAPNRMRSAIAPVISAGVMTANIIWYAMNSDGGIVSESPGGAVLQVAASTRSRGCRSSCSVPPKASEYTTTAQSTLTRPRQKKFCMSIVEHVLGPDHAAVEQREAGRHEHDQRGRAEHPRGVAGVDLHRVSPPIESVRNSPRVHRQPEDGGIRAASRCAACRSSNGAGQRP